MKRHQYKVITLALAIILMCCGCSGNSEYDLSQLKKEPVTYNSIQSAGNKSLETSDIEGWILSKENNYLSLFYNEKTAAIRVFDKRSGSWWDSNPNSDSLSNAATSQIALSTVDNKGVFKDYYSSSDSVLKNQVDINNGDVLTVTYTFGNIKPDLSSVPARLTDERFLELQQRVEESGGNEKLLKRRYTQDDDGIWVRKTTLTADQSKKLRELFESIGYTAEELALDTKEAGGTAEEENTSFSIPVEYKLEEDSLVVSVSGKDTVYPNNEIITSLNILGYFGALEANEDGYFLIPNGSGALVNTTKQSAGMGAYTLRLYGTDYTIPVERESGKDVENLMPVFGISRTNDGVFAIIEENDAVASIKVSKSGNVDDLNTVSASFELNTVENIGLSDDDISKFYVTSDKKYEGNSTIRFIFLSDDYHTYSGMASVYRDYLDNYYKRETIKDNGDIPLFIETVGSVEGETSTLGFVHKHNVALTTFEDDISILKDIKNSGISDVRLILSGWMNGGENPTLANKVKVVSELGGSKELNSLLKFANENGYTVYPKLLLNTFSSNDSVITKNIYASKTLGSEKSIIYAFDKLTGKPLSNGSQRYILSPMKQLDLSNELSNALQKKSINSVLIDDLSTTIFSDYSNNSEALRQYSLLQAADITNNYSEKFEDLMLTAPNVNTASFSDVYTDVPYSSGSHTVFECSVPFYQMVYHGYADYSSEPLNFTADYKTNFLKCAEYGSCVKFRFIYNESVDLSPVEETQYYAAHYNRWKEKMIESYTELNELLSPVRNSIMISHIKLADGVYCTGYENGMKIYVNYNDKPVKVEDIEIPALQAIRKDESR